MVGKIDGHQPGAIRAAAGHPKGQPGVEAVVSETLVDNRAQLAARGHPVRAGGGGPTYLIDDAHTLGCDGGLIPGDPGDRDAGRPRHVLNRVSGAQP
jgi:hypothetical protein